MLLRLLFAMPKVSLCLDVLSQKRKILILITVIQMDIFQNSNQNRVGLRGEVEEVCMEIHISKIIKIVSNACLKMGRKTAVKK